MSSFWAGRFAANSTTAAADSNKRRRIGVFPCFVGVNRGRRVAIGTYPDRNDPVGVRQPRIVRQGGASGAGSERKIASGGVAHQTGPARGRPYLLGITAAGDFAWTLTASAVRPAPGGRNR